MSTRQNVYERRTRNTRNFNLGVIQVLRKRKGRPSTSTDSDGNNIKRCCPASRMENVSKIHNSDLVDECGIEDLSLEAHESFESPLKGKEKSQVRERRQSLRSYTNHKSEELENQKFFNGNPCSIDSRFISNALECPLPKLQWADPNDVWEKMKRREIEYQKDACYFQRHPNLQVRMRSILLDWLIEVCEVYRLHRETFHLAAEFVDRYLSTERKIAKQRLQLIGVTSLFIAAKIEEIYPPKIAEFAYVTDGACTVEEITKQELLILQALKWKLSPVTSNSWVSTYLQILSSISMRPQRNKSVPHFEFPKFPPIQLTEVSQLIDLCLLDMKSLQYKNSVIAASSIYHVLPYVNLPSVTGYSWNDLRDCIQWLVPFNQTVKENKMKGVKHFDKIPADDAHNIQIHNCGIQLLDKAHEKLTKASTQEAATRTSPVQYEGILTPPSSTKKDY